MNASAYTLAGALSSILLGTSLAVGARAAIQLSATLAVAALVGLGLALVAHDLGIVRLPLLQLHRQTNPLWAKTFRSTTAAALWGLDLGLTVTTWASFSGAWLLFGWILLHESTLIAAILLLSFWIGRALPIWIVPVVARTSETSEIITFIHRQRRMFQLVHVSAVASTTLALVLITMA